MLTNLNSAAEWTGSEIITSSGSPNTILASAKPTPALTSSRLPCWHPIRTPPLILPHVRVLDRRRTSVVRAKARPEPAPLLRRAPRHSGAVELDPPVLVRIAPVTPRPRGEPVHAGA